MPNRRVNSPLVRRRLATIVMPRIISESDWGIFRNLHAIAPERFCQRVLSDINQISSDATRASHQRYLAIFKLIERRDREFVDVKMGDGHPALLQSWLREAFVASRNASPRIDIG